LPFQETQILNKAAKEEFKIILIISFLLKGCLESIVSKTFIASFTQESSPANNAPPSIAKIVPQTALYATNAFTAPETQAIGGR